LSAYLQRLLALPIKVRLSIVILCWLPGALLFSPEKAIYGTLFGLSTALAAWMFKYRGGLLCVGMTMLYIFIVNTISMRTLLWDRYHTLSFVLGSVAITFATLLIGYLRILLDIAQAGKEQANRALEQQQQLNNLKDQFLLNVSHELRTPLTEVQGYLELLKDHGGKLELEMQKTFVENALRGCEELQTLIANVLDAMYFDEQTGKRTLVAQREPLQVLEIVREILRGFELQLHGRAVELNIPPTLKVWAGRLHMRQVLYNLLSNALKYSPEGSVICIQASLWNNQPNGTGLLRQVCICVKDAGPGIPPDEMPHLFGRFMRLERDISGPIRGSGLGLYICKQLVEGMGGTIWAESSGVPGEGSCFCFTLPAVPSSAQLCSKRETIVPFEAHSW